MTLTHRILRALPATLPELAAILQAAKRTVNAALHDLRAAGLVHRTQRRGLRYGPRGPAPCIWARGAAAR